MAYFKYLIFPLLAVSAVPASAFYVNATPPPGWSVGSAVNTFKFAQASTATSTILGRIGATAAVSVSGQSVAIPSSLKLAANAARVAAKVSFGNPLLFLGVSAAALAYQWYTDNGLKVEDGKWVKVEPGCPAGACFEYSIDFSPYSKVTGAASPAAACAAVGGNHPYNTNYITRTVLYDSDTRCLAYIKDSAWPQFAEEVGGNAPITKTQLPPTPPKSVPVTQPEFEETMAPVPLPQMVPSSFPRELGIEWPVEQPVMNPSPANPPLPQPFFVPTGNPVSTPDPAIWNQPGVRVTPAPTTDSPWRVDVQPENLPQDSPVPKTPAQLNPTTPLTPSPGTPPPAPGLCDMYPGIAACAPADKYAPGDEAVKDPAKTPGTPEFCANNPTALICQKIDTPEQDDLLTKDKTISITPDSGWGSGGGSCPAPRQFSKGEFSFQIYCDFASGIKPVIIAVAWLVAAGILIGFKFGES